MQSPRRYLIASAAVAVGVVSLNRAVGLNLPGIPHLPTLRHSQSAAVNVPLVERAWPAARMVVAEGIVRTRGTSTRRTGPCGDNRAADITATVQLVAEPPTNGADVDAWSTQVVVSEVNLDRDDGGCSRLAHLIGRPTSSPKLDSLAIDGAVEAAKACGFELPGHLGGIDAVMGKALAPWAIDPTGRTFVFTTPTVQACAWLEAPSVPSEPVVADAENVEVAA